VQSANNHVIARNEAIANCAGLMLYYERGWFNNLPLFIFISPAPFSGYPFVENKQHKYFAP
jgi:hypothetical protein